MDFVKPFNAFGFPFKRKYKPLNACGNRLPTIYNPFIFTRLTENR